MSGSAPVWIDRCVCGHVKDSHEVVVNAGRMTMGPCRCGCLGFRLRESSIEEKIAALPPLPPKWSAPLSMPAPETSVLPEEVSSDGQLIEEPPAVAEPPVDQPGSALPLVHRRIESFNAWRCPVCGMRSFRQDSCHRVMEPVRVEIHSREVP